MNKAVEAAVRAIFASIPEARVQFMIIAQGMREDLVAEGDQGAIGGFDQLVAQFAPGPWSAPLHAGARAIGHLADATPR